MYTGLERGGGRGGVDGMVGKSLELTRSGEEVVRGLKLLEYEIGAAEGVDQFEL